MKTIIDSMQHHKRIEDKLFGQLPCIISHWLTELRHYRAQSQQHWILRKRLAFRWQPSFWKMGCSGLKSLPIRRFFGGAADTSEALVSPWSLCHYDEYSLLLLNTCSISWVVVYYVVVVFCYKMLCAVMHKLYLAGPLLIMLECRHTAQLHIKHVKQLSFYTWNMANRFEWVSVSSYLHHQIGLAIGPLALLNCKHFKVGQNVTLTKLQ